MASSRKASVAQGRSSCQSSERRGPAEKQSPQSPGSKLSVVPNPENGAHHCPSLQSSCRVQRTFDESWPMNYIANSCVCSSQKLTRSGPTTDHHRRHRDGDVRPSGSVAATIDQAWTPLTCGSLLDSGELSFGLLDVLLLACCWLRLTALPSRRSPRPRPSSPARRSSSRFCVTNLLGDAAGNSTPGDESNDGFGCHLG